MPSLQMNTSSNWASNDAAYTNATNYWSNAFPIGSLAEYQNPPTSGIVVAGSPYEYIYTIESPNNSGVNTNYMYIYETNIVTVTYYNNTNIMGYTNLSTNSNYYMTNNGSKISYTLVNAPTNPIMYAFDAPGIGEVGLETNMTIFKANKAVVTTILQSYPLYNDFYPTLDSNTERTHVFNIICTSDSTNGTGPYHWTNSY